jgi:phosphoribosyl 1,2-cyclic phosphate phosphodiesterase
MHSDLDYEALRHELPANVVPAYDGMRLEIGGPSLISTLE